MVDFSSKMKSKKKNSKMTMKKGKKYTRAPPKQNASLLNKNESAKEDDKAPMDNKTLLIAQEVKFARLLAGNDKKLRDKVLKSLQKWLVMRSKSSFVFTDSDFMRLWKGLFYCMWMSDKPLVQEELAESLSKIVHCFNSIDTALLYTKCTLKTLAIEWFGIDRYRVDKFEMLVKRILRQTFEMCKRELWNKKCVTGVAKVIEEILVDPKTCLGLSLHITEVYMEELAKISRGKIKKSIVTELVRPFVIHLSSIDDQRQIKHIVEHIFRYLIIQSDIGLDYAEKFKIWKQAGFPCQSIDEIQKIEVSDDDEEIQEENDQKVEETNIPLDPRAGRVDVEIPQLPFDPNEIVSLLKEYKFHKLSTTKTRRTITRLINDFSKLSEGDMPLGIKEIPPEENTKVNPYEAAEELLNFDQKIYLDSNRNNRKRKKNSTSKYSESFNNVEEIIVPQDVQYNALKNDNSKKQKLTISNDLDNMQKNSKLIKKNNNQQIPTRKKSKRLSVIGAPKKTSKKLNNTITCIEEDKIIGTDDLSANNGSTSCNWDVDIPSKSITTPTSSDKKIQEKVIAEKKRDPKLKLSKKSWLTPVLVRLEEQNKVNKSAVSASKAEMKQIPETGARKKRVKIILQRNTERNISQYIHQIRQNPAIPYDANKKPKASVLKPSPLPSPINPFYKRRMA